MTTAQAADWREAALSRVLTLTLLAGPPSLVTMVVMPHTVRVDAALVAVAGSLMVVAAMRLMPSLGLRRRTWVAVVALTVAAATPMYAFGPLLGSGLTMAVAAVIAAL